jgi:hypothetical protein
MVRFQGYESAGMSSDSIVVAAKDQVSSDLGGEVAILDLKVGVYYGLDEVGANEVLTVARGQRSSARLYKSLSENLLVTP